MKWSRFGRAFGPDAGIVRLMDDLGEALGTGERPCMLGGGNPGHVPEVARRLRENMRAIADDPGAFDRLVGQYGPPEGDHDFRKSLAALLRREYGWPITAANIGLTNGSQSASFMLFNLLAGEDEAGQPLRILLPLTPEYIGYADQGLHPGMFVSERPTIEHLEPDIFKYHVDLDRLRITGDTAALCVSRPTNPTGNVLSDEEIEALASRASEHRIPLILDNAYGTPFPDIVFSRVTPYWTPQTIVCMSLSKLGLPGVRTGIVIAREEVVSALAGINAIVNLTTGGFGPALATGLVASGEILTLSRDHIRPFYLERSQRAVALLRAALEGCDYHIHKPEGAIFVWVWFRDLPITSEALYQRLKQRGVVVLAGQHFFPGLRDDWKHRDECIRINYSGDAREVERGIAVIGQEVKAAYEAG